jgi:phage terminase large subunit-like protein
MKQNSLKDQVREHALSDLYSFIMLIHPNRVLGHVHKEVISWWTRQESKSHQLLLLPRDHQKSALIAYRVAWEITKNPAIRVLYISSTSNLATKQLKFIKDILTSDIYRFYWPEMVLADEAKREKWTETEISVDHPKRKAEAVRDPTVFTAGLTTTIVGLHCDLAVLDDVVIDDTAYSEEGRTKVRNQVSYLASIAGTDSSMWAVGTRYHPKDLYNDFLTAAVDVFDEEGNVIDSESLWEVFERQVETRGDGTGDFLWPRIQRGDGKWFGFSREILAKKKAQYHDLTKFRAQYYNNPNDLSSANIKPELFQYYERNHLHRENGRWTFKGKRLNIFAAVDFAFSVKKEADSTAIVVIGIDGDHNIYVLDIERFKTTAISEYYDRILRLHVKWDFRKIRAEVTSAQTIIVEDLKNNYIRPNGLALVMEPVRPTKNKEERIEAILQPRYMNRQVYHYSGGNCELLEEELIMQKPAHDDIKDALASAVEIAVPPSFMNLGVQARNKEALHHPRFGGIC